MKPPIVSLGIATLRLALAAVFFAHAGLKLLVFGLNGTAEFFTAHQIPGWLAYPVFGAEAAGAVFLAVGIAVRITSVILAGVVLGAIYVHAPYGWAFTAPGGGWEYPAFLMLTLIVQAMLGPGSLQSVLKNNDAGKDHSSRQELTARGLVVLLAAGSLASTSRLEAGDSSVDARVLQHNRQIGERYFEEVWNKGDVDVLDDLLTADYINHTPSTPNPLRGPAGLKPIVRAIRTGFPDLRYEIQDIVVTSDRVVMRVTMTGTNTGVLFGKAPTGNKIRVNQINIEKIRDGRIAEHWRVTDEAEMQRQLGPG